MNWKDLKKMNKGKLMDMVGMRQSSTPDWLLPGIAFFGAGLVIGAGIGLMLAPKSGQELREDLRARMQRGEGELATTTGSRTPAAVR